MATATATAMATAGFNFYDVASSAAQLRLSSGGARTLLAAVTSPPGVPAIAGPRRAQKRASLAPQPLICMRTRQPVCGSVAEIEGRGGRGGGVGRGWGVGMGVVRQWRVPDSPLDRS